MVWILNEVNKPIEVRLGSVAMLAASNVFMTHDEAKAAQQVQCIHETKIGNLVTWHIQCADCGKTLN